MFARRTAWDLEPSDLARGLAARRAAGLPVVDLCASNPTACGLKAAGRLLADALAAVARDPRALRYDPDPKGDLACRRAIADYHASLGASVAPEEIILTAGTSEAYAHLFRLLGDPGDRVLVPTPGYPLFELLAGLEGLEAGAYPLRLRDGAFRIDFEALEAACDERTRAVLVVHPHNPTGAFVRSADAVALRRLCAERRLALVSDEVFADFASAAGDWPASFLAAGASDGPLTFALSGASKVVAVPQLKVAWIAASGPAQLRDEALRRLEVIADSYLSVSGPAQLLLPRLLEGRREVQAELRARVAGNRAHLAARLAGHAGVSLLPADGGWQAIVRITASCGGAPPDEDALAARLLDGPGVAVHPGWLFDLAPGPAEPCAHVVVSLLPAEDEFARGAEALALEAARAAAEGAR